MTSVEVSNLTDQYIRIHDSLRAVGLHADYIHNEYDEPVAVRVSDAFNPADAKANIPLQRSMEAPYGELADDRRSLRDHFPLSGARVYPRSVLDIVDNVCQAAAGTEDGLAHELKSPVQLDNRGLWPKNLSLGLHIDYGCSEAYLSEGLAMHGLNVHLTWYGSYVAELGIVRKLLTANDLEVAKEQAEENGRFRGSALAELYADLGAPFVRTQVMNEGDMLIFQGRQHVERGIPAVAHNFRTVSTWRRSDVIRPHLGDTNTVIEKREELASKYHLHELGY